MPPSAPPSRPGHRFRQILALAAVVLLGAGAARAQDFGRAVDHALRSIANPVPGQIAARPPQDGYADGRVILYRTSWCGYCRKAAAFMQRNGIPYVERDVEANRAYYDEQRRLGGRGVPFIVFGQRTLSGYDERLILQYYQDMSAAGGYGAPGGHVQRPYSGAGHRPGGYPPPPAHPGQMPPPGARAAGGPLPGDLLALRMSILNLHDGPDAGTRVIVTLTRADRVVYLGETRNGMYRVASEQGEGWVDTLHVRPPRAGR